MFRFVSMAKSVTFGLSGAKRLLTPKEYHAGAAATSISNLMAMLRRREQSSHMERSTSVESAAMPRKRV
jgi:hypothetical protein